MEPVLGMRVVRGPDWNWGDQDGGKGYVGTVVGVDQVQKGVAVQWDMGHQCNYRCGKDNKFDIRVLDTAQIGIKHKVHCVSCEEVIWGFLWRCVHCLEAGNLCSECYMANKHSTLHSFIRIDLAGRRVKVPPRYVYISRAVDACGVFPGAKVVRGVDWRWDDQDGGPGNVGEVINIQNWKEENARSIALVSWRGRKNKKYRLGHKGKVDLKCINGATTGTYYPTHLPVLGTQESVPTTSSDLLAAGDQVKVVVDIEEWKRLQQGHGDWDDNMTELIGTPGLVQHITETGDLIVTYPGIAIFPINPEAVTKEDIPTSYRVGDVVKVNDNKEYVIKMQKGHGDWSDEITESLDKTGRIVKVLPSGDVQVSIAGRRWVLNPFCLQPAPDQQTTLETGEKQLSDLVKTQLESLVKQSSPDVVVAASAAGDLDILRNFLQNNPSHVDARVKGKTALLVATAEGWPEIVTTLLYGYNASVNEKDEEGDTALHYCAHLDREDIARILLDHKADPNICNGQGIPPMFYAIALGNYDVLRTLVDSGDINLDLKDNDGNTGLHVAVLGHRSEAVRILLEEDANPTIHNNTYGNPILEAATTGFYLGLEQFIERCRDDVISSRDGDGNTALHIAAANNHIDIVCLLCDMEACDVDATNTVNHQTALHIAACEGNTRIIECLLVQYNARPNITDSERKSPLELVIANKTSIKTPSEYSPHTLQISREIQGPRSQSPDNYIAVGCLMVRNRATFMKDNLISNFECTEYFINLLAAYSQK